MVLIFKNDDFSNFLCTRASLSLFNYDVISIFRIIFSKTIYLEHYFLHGNFRQHKQWNYDFREGAESAPFLSLLVAQKPSLDRVNAVRSHRVATPGLRPSQPQLLLRLGIK